MHVYDALQKSFAEENMDSIHFLIENFPDEACTIKEQLIPLSPPSELLQFVIVETSDSPEHDKYLKSLIERGGKEFLLRKNRWGENLLFAAVHHKANIEVIDLIIEVGDKDVILQKNDDEGINAFHVACRSNLSLNSWQKMIDICGRELIFETDNEGNNSSLIAACWHDDSSVDLIHRLIDLGGKELMLQSLSDGFGTVFHDMSKNHLQKPGGIFQRIISEIDDACVGDVITKRDRLVNTALHYACENFCGEMDMIDLLIDFGGSQQIMEQNDDGLTPLHQACQIEVNHRVNIEALITKLLAFGGRDLVMVENILNYTALHHAVENKFPESIIIRLIEMSDDNLFIHTSDPCLLHYACRYQASPKIVNMLIDKCGAKYVATTCIRGETTLTEACKGGQPFEVLDRIIKCEIIHQVHQSSAIYATALHHYLESRKADLRSVKMFIEVGRDQLEIKDVMYAISSGASIDIINHLLDCSVDRKECLLQTNQFRGNLLHCAISKQQPVDMNVVEMLLEIGGKPMVMEVDQRGQTPLHVACQCTDDLDLISRLLGIGGKELLVMKSRIGETTLHSFFGIMKSCKDYIPIIETFYAIGGKNVLFEVTSDKMTALDFAVRRGELVHPKYISDFILFGGKDLCFMKSVSGWNVWHNACAFNAPNEILDFLLDCGGKALISSKNDLGQGGLHFCLMDRLNRLTTPRKGYESQLRKLKYIVTKGVEYNVGGGEFSIGELFMNSCEDTQNRIYEQWKTLVGPMLYLSSDWLLSTQQPILHAAIIAQAPRYVIIDLIRYFDCLKIKDSSGRIPIHVGVEQKLKWEEGMNELMIKHTESSQGRSMINVAAECGLKWCSGMKEIVDQTKFDDDEYEKDKITGFYPFMLAAVVDKLHLLCDLDCIFELARRFPHHVKN